MVYTSIFLNPGHGTHDHNVLILKARGEIRNFEKKMTCGSLKVHLIFFITISTFLTFENPHILKFKATGQISNFLKNRREDSQVYTLAILSYPIPVQQASKSPISDCGGFFILFCNIFRFFCNIPL